MLPLHPLDRLVARHVEIGGIGGEFEVSGRREAVVVRGFPIPGDMDAALTASLLGPGVPPRAGDEIVGGARLPSEEVHRNHRELQARAPLDEHHLVILTDPEQPPEI